MFASDILRATRAQREALAGLAAGLDPDDVPASQASALYAELDQIARIAAAARTLVARRVEDSREWKRRGHRSAAEALAAIRGSSIGEAKRELETSKALSGLAGVRSRMLDGSLSADQGSVIADAAKANPEAERSLVEAAKTANLHELRTQAQRAKAAADPDPEATHRRIHRNRRLSRFTDGEGARHLRLVGPVDLVSIIEAEIDRRIDAFVHQSPAGEELPSRGAMGFDALVEVARRSSDPGSGNTGKSTRPEHLALLRLDVSALWRGHVEGDELCEVTGLGPIPVAVARRLLGDAVLKLIVTKGEAVAQVTSLTRGPTQAMRYALLWSNPTCVVEGCSRTVTEYDHRWGAEFKDTRHTRLDELDRVCTGHHDLHTQHGWALVEGTGKRPLVAPDDPRHPANAPPPAHTSAADLCGSSAA